jgi:hypothetical protein
MYFSHRTRVEQCSEPSVRILTRHLYKKNIHRREVEEVRYTGHVVSEVPSLTLSCPSP